MLFIRLFYLLRGYVIFECYGYFVEKFLNIASKKQISLWGIKKIKDGGVRARISVKDFKLLKVPAKKANVKIKIISKRGLPFILHRYRKRTGVILGTVIFFALLWVMSSFIWSVEVMGNHKVDASDILKSLNYSGIKQGVLGMTCDTKKATVNLMMEFPQISWADISIKGSKVIVNVKEGVVPPTVISKDKPCNIVARKDGQIILLEVFEGSAAVKKGYTVSKGQLIVNGVLDSATFGVRKVHARAMIRARTLTTIKVEVPLKRQENMQTGNKYSRYVLQFGNISVKLYLGKIKYETYRKEEKVNELSIGKEIILPIRLVHENIFQTEVRQIELTENEAKIEAEQLLLEKEKTELMGLFVKERAINFYIENNLAIFEGEYVCEEDIGNEIAIE
jgi:similar to stage IV sporulation protein